MALRAASGNKSAIYEIIPLAQPQTKESALVSHYPPQDDHTPMVLDRLL
jgi:hypothetical protein